MKKIIFLLITVLFSVSVFALDILTDNNIVYDIFISSEDFGIADRANIVCTDRRIYGANMKQYKITKVIKAIPIDFKISKYTLTSNATNYIKIIESIVVSTKTK